MNGRQIGLLIGLALLSACQAGENEDAVPSSEQIGKLEARLSRHSCVGDLRQWERNYRFSRKPGIFGHRLIPDVEVIEIHLRRVGSVTIAPGRNVMSSGPGGGWPDSKPIQTIDGRFQLSNEALSLQRCRPLR